MPVSEASTPPILRTRRAGLVGRAVGAAFAGLIADATTRGAATSARNRSVSARSGLTAAILCVKSRHMVTPDTVVPAWCLRYFKITPDRRLTPDAIAKTVAELTSQQDGVIRQQVISS